MGNCSYSLKTLFLSLLIPGVIAAIGFNAAAMILPLLVIEFGAGEALAASITGLRGLGSLFVNIPAGELLRKIGATIAMVLSLSLMALGVILTMFARYPSLITMGSILVGAGYGAWFLGRMVYITHFVPMSRRGRVIASISGTERIGRLLGPLLGGILIALLGYLGSLFCLVVLIFISILIFLMSVWTKITSGDVVVPERSVNYWNLLLRHKHVIFTAGIVSLAIKYFKAARIVFIPIWGLAVSYSAAQIGSLVALSAVMEILLAYPCGVIMDKYGRRPAAGISVFLFSIGFFLFPIFQNKTGLIASIVFIGLGEGLSGGIIMAMSTDSAPNYERASFLGVWRLVSDLGSAFGPFVIALIISRFSANIAGIVTSLFALVTVCFIVCKLPETRPSQDDVVARG